MNAHKDRPEASRMEVVEMGRRRRWTEEEKLRIVMESLGGARLGMATARRYGIARSLLWKWRRQFDVRSAGSSTFVPALVVPESSPASARSSRMEILLANGRRIIVDVGVEVAALGRVLDALERR